MVESNHITFVISAIISLHILQASGQLKFIGKEWHRLKRLAVDSNLIVDCRTNNVKASVTLHFRKSRERSWQNVERMSKFNNRVSRNGQKFTIKAMKISDAGDFLCKAERKEFQIGRTIVFHSLGKVKPQIKPQKLSISIETYGSKNITCTTDAPTGDKQGTILSWWYKAEGAEKKIKLMNGIVWKKDIPSQTGNLAKFTAILMLTNFQQINTGTYFCVRKKGKRITDHLIKIERKPDKVPVVTLIPGDDVLKPNVSSNLTIECKFSGSPTPTVVWRKNGKIIDNCHKVSPCIKTIYRVLHMQDSGIYACSASNFLANVTESTIVEVQVPPRVKRLPKRTYYFKRGEEVEFSVHILEGNPAPRVRWDRKYTCPADRVCAEDHLLWDPVLKQTPDRNTLTSTSYMLTSPNDKDQTYRVVVENSIGKDGVKFDVIRKDDDDAKIQFDMIPDGKTPLTVIEEKSFKIICRTDPTIFKQAKLIQNRTKTVPTTERKEGDMRILEYEVKSTNYNNTGDYKCMALSTVAKEYREEKVLVFMKALFPPVINLFDDDIVYAKNKNTKITCVVDGLPPPQVSWSFNDEPLSNLTKINTFSKCKITNSGRYLLQDLPNALAICRMKFVVHQGMYTCIAKNKKGSVFKNMMLTIKEKPTTPEYPRTVTISYGIDHIINCSVSSNPPANVSWYRTNPLDNRTTLVSSAFSNSMLVLTWHESNTAGTYKCQAINNQGNATGKPMEVIITERALSPAKETWKIIVGVLVTAAVLLLISFVFCWLWMRYFKKTYAKFLEPNKHFEFDPDLSLFEQSIDLPYDVAWEFPRKRINFLKLLGSGEFGQVWLANAKGIRRFKPRDKSNEAVRRRRMIQSTNVCCKCTCGMDDDSDGHKPMVAVKTLKSDASESDYKDLASELKILIHLGEHSNIVNVLGACTKEGKLHVLLEYCPNGNLLNFLRTRREMFEDEWKKDDNDMANEFTFVDLMVIVYQVAKGMDFLQSRKCVHRDLATRNVLVGENYTMKIADFGLARDIYKEDVYLKKTAGLLPLKWMAPEALFDKMHTSMSDVWSYGILLWEVFTLGGSPYPSVPSEDLFNFLRSGRRMERPEHCPPAVYTIMLDCWSNAPNRRPMFSDIKQRLKDIQSTHFPNSNAYVNISFGNDTNGNRSSIFTPTQHEVHNNEPPRVVNNSPSLPLTMIRNELQTSPSSSKEPLLYSNVPTTPTSNPYVTMTASDHYKTPSAPTHEYVPYTDDKDGGTYV